MFIDDDQILMLGCNEHSTKILQDSQTVAHLRGLSLLALNPTSRKSILLFFVAVVRVAVRWIVPLRCSESGQKLVTDIDGNRMHWAVVKNGHYQRISMLWVWRLLFECASTDLAEMCWTSDISISAIGRQILVLPRSPKVQAACSSMLNCLAEAEVEVGQNQLPEPVLPSWRKHLLPLLYSYGSQQCTP